MKKYVLAVEGIDGSGKTSIVHELVSLCAQRGVPCTVIGRRSDSASPAVGAFTAALQTHGAVFSPETDLLVRVAREYQRAHDAASVLQGLVVLDRFVLSVYARSLTEQLSTLPVEALLARAATIAHLDGTLFIRCDFSQAWTRITSGAATLGFKESRGEAYNREFASQHEKAFRNSSLTADRLEVENTDSLDQLLRRSTQAVETILQSLRPTEGTNND